MRSTLRFAVSLLLLSGATPLAWSHPGSGIVVDHRGYLWFMDTGYGLWQIDPAGHLTAQAGLAGHFLAIDRRQQFEQKHFADLEPGDIEMGRFDPRLLVATSYPITVGSDGALYYPQVAGKGRVRIMRMNPGQPPEAFAELPPVRERSAGSEPVDAEWIWGIAAGPEGSIYYTEQQAVRRIAADGTVTTVAENVEVAECERPEAFKDSTSRTNLYGLDVAADGTVYAAATGCSAVLKITSDGNVSVFARSTDRWSPTGVAVAGDRVYLLEYDYVASDDRADWYPRVRRVDPDGTITILAQVEKRPEHSTMGFRRLPGTILEDVAQPARAHAAIVHFPIVLFLVSVPLAIAALALPRRPLLRVQLLLLFAAIFVLCRLAETSGESAERQIPYGTDGVPGVAWEYLRQHTAYATSLGWIAMAGTILSGIAVIPSQRRGATALRVVVLTLLVGAALAGSMAAIVTGHYGGELVYGQGLGSTALNDYLAEKSRDNRDALRLVMHENGPSTADPATATLIGSKPGEERTIAGTQLCWCPPGRFEMGSPPSEPERRPFERQVSVTLTSGFWTGTYEVTQGDWKRVMGALPGETTKELPADDTLPVGNVNFAEAEQYCEKLTEMARKSGELPAGWEFRLPTEAQWEYACRAGTTTATSFGDSIGSQQANTKGDQPYNGAAPGPTLGRAAKVGSYPANPWGIHDMHGNTCEWCRDWAHQRHPGGVDPDLHDAQATATRNESGSYSRSRRGSCWADPCWASRSAFRQRFEPERRYDHIGFRVALVRT